MSVFNSRQRELIKVSYTTSDGETYLLHDPPTKWVFDMAGWGISESDLATNAGPFQHGESPVNIKLKPRTISLSFRHNGYSKSGYWTNRGLLIDILRENRVSLNSPVPGVLKFYYIEDSVVKTRALDVFLVEGLQFAPPPTGRWDEWSIQETISFVALNPLVYDPTQVIASFGAPTEQLILPMQFPFVLGCYTISQTITYSGTWEEYPIITITGPAKNITILNDTTDQRINLAYDIAAGEVVTFDLRYDFKTVSSTYADRLDEYLTEGNIGTFSLQCDPLVASGSNVLYFYTEAYDPGVTVCSVKYYTRYRGI
jgi:hypothetical protein